MIRFTLTVPLPHFVPWSMIDFRLFFHWPPRYVSSTSTVPEKISGILRTLKRFMDVQRAIFWLLCKKEPFDYLFLLILGQSQRKLMRNEIKSALATTSFSITLYCGQSHYEDLGLRLYRNAQYFLKLPIVPYWQSGLYSLMEHCSCGHVLVDLIGVCL